MNPLKLNEEFHMYMSYVKSLKGTYGLQGIQSHHFSCSTHLLSATPHWRRHIASRHGQFSWLQQTAHHSSILELCIQL